MQLCEQQDLFVSGQGGYVRYRIPALAVTLQGTILAFCEARKFTGRDSDQIDLFLRRSLDGGRTFGDVQLVTTEEGWVCGNPAPVVDRDTGTIWLLLCKNLQDGDEGMICEGKAPRTVWVTHSEDDGATWAEPREITRAVKPDRWSWYATGPCHGVQLQSGRLVIPCDHIVLRERNRQDPHHSHVLYSDDHGHTWLIGGSADEGTNESTVVETTDGWLYLNCRNKGRLEGGGSYRAIAWSRDGGITFSPIVHDAALLEPVCQASVCRFTTQAEHGRDHVLFSNPASRTRDQLTVRLSYDECRTWPVSRVLHPGPAAYSDLCVSPDMSICCLYERGYEGPYETITLARFNLEWLTDGQDALFSSTCL
jgi:sialidase-1